VVIHSGEPVALACSWDAAEGGAWKDSGLEMPDSLCVHAACGKAVFDSLKVRGKTWFIGFSGVLPPHKPHLFGYLAVSSFMMGRALGFPDGFQYTLLPSLSTRAGSVFEEFGSEAENTQWHLEMAQIAVDAEKAAADELQAMEGGPQGVVTCSLTNMDFALGEESEWMARAAATVRLKTGAEIRGPAQEMATNHVEWLRQIQ